MTIVRPPCGALRGTETKGIHSFKGIPYAESLAGPARWLPPTPRQPWESVRDASEYGPACMQFGAKHSRWTLPTVRTRYFEAMGGLQTVAIDDDCLRLNIWSPSTDRAANLPVMVWIHGGGFTSGSANAMYDGTPFAERGVVCVAIQYRLGPLGFLHGSELFKNGLCSDNRAFQDQLCALEWIQQNIAAFGGDASRVTLFGQSAGAFAIFQLSASPQARGLFHRAIAMGGMAGTCAPAGEYHQLAADALQEVGVHPGDADALIALDDASLSKLQSILSRRIFRNKNSAQYGALSRERVGFLGAAFGTDFLPQRPLDIFRTGTPNNIDLMLGTCKNDGGLFSQIIPFSRALSARLFSKNLLGLMPRQDLAAVQEHYQRHLPGVDKSKRIEQINNDAFYRMPTIQAAEAHAQAHPGKTWHYQLNYDSPLPGLGAIHAVDVALLFQSHPSSILIHDDEATQSLSNQLRHAMVSFASNGIPATSPPLPEWRPYDAVTRSTLVFDRQSRLENDLDGHLRTYWNFA